MAKVNGYKNEYFGLTEIEVKLRQAEHGKNELVAEEKNTFIKKAISIIKEPMFLLLFGVAVLYFILGEPIDGMIMIGFVTFMAGINLFQEWRTDKTLDALKELSAPTVRVVRTGEIICIDCKEIAVGDIMLIEEGEKISADCKILEMHDLGVDESTLTGESEVVWKKVQISKDELESNWRKDMCYAGTNVTQGGAVVEVTAVGIHSEYGKIGMDILSVPQESTPLEKQTGQLIKYAALMGLLLFLLVFVIAFFTLKDKLPMVDNPLLDRLIHSLLSGLTLAMAMIPEEFPVILTVFLAMGAWRLAQKKALIRRMPSVETLGAVSVLCVDKTGTLTKNQMTVQEMYVHEGETQESMLLWSSLACETEPFDPMEKAILEHAEKNGINLAKTFSNNLVHEYPFSSETKMMGHVWENGGVTEVAAKGSPESILPLCGLADAKYKQVLEVQERLAQNGYRVIAVAKSADLKQIPENLAQNSLVLIGLIGLMDPPREAVPDAIQICSKAGIRVVMITGDNGTTAKSIASKIGILHSENVITGQELETMSDEELMLRVRDTNIFARVIPRHKMRIVKALKDIGEIVAMTGDGVNDAPALKYSDIGIAMGKRGTGVAKEAADMILLDDNFTTIVETIKDGRRIYDNIKKAIGYVFVIHIPIALIALLAPLLGLPLMLLPIHIVLLELIIDPTCSIIFERLRPERDIMLRAPRNPKAQLVSKSLLIKALLQGVSILCFSFGSYAYLLINKYPENFARAFALVVLGVASLLLVYVNRSEKRFAFSDLFKFNDKVVWYVNSGIIAILALVIYTPVGNSYAKTVALGPEVLGFAFALAFASTFWWEIVKLIRYFLRSGSRSQL
ncbi:MAG: cation-translocating P-type ATPase [Bacillota bacterium]